MDEETEAQRDTWHVQSHTPKNKWQRRDLNSGDLTPGYVPLTGMSNGSSDSPNVAKVYLKYHHLCGAFHDFFQ